MTRFLSAIFYQLPFLSAFFRNVNLPSVNVWVDVEILLLKYPDNHPLALHPHPIEIEDEARSLNWLTSLESGVARAQKEIKSHP